MGHKSLLLRFAGITVLSLSPYAAFISRADVIDTVSLDTTRLVGSVAGPFQLSFQFNDGSGLGDGNNTVTLSNFAFGGGSAVGPATEIGGSTGDLSTSVVLTDTNFFNYFAEGFTPGATLSFRIDATTNIDAGPIPDAFSFAILDNTGSELPTLGFASQFLELDIDSATPSPQVFASDPTQAPVAGGNPLSIAAPQVAPVNTNSVPEPSSAALLIAGFFGIGLFASRRSFHRADK